MAELAPVLKQTFLDSNGDPLAGGKLYSYIAGTSTPLSTYTDSGGSTPNANPTILDANGQADVWLGSGTYKFVLNDSDDVTQWTIDDVNSAANPSTPSGWTEHNVTDGQSATDLTGETVDSDDYSSALYEYEIIRGTTIVASGRLAIQDVNSSWRVVDGGYMIGEAEVHGVTFSVSQSGTVATLRAALDSGAGSGTIKLSRRLIAA